MNDFFAKLLGKPTDDELRKAEELKKRERQEQQLVAAFFDQTRCGAQLLVAWTKMTTTQRIGTPSTPLATSEGGSSSGGGGSTRASTAASRRGSRTTNSTTSTAGLTVSSTYVPDDAFERKVVDVFHDEETRNELPRTVVAEMVARLAQFSSFRSGGGASSSNASFESAAVATAASGGSANAQLFACLLSSITALHSICSIRGNCSMIFDVGGAAALSAALIALNTALERCITNLSQGSAAAITSGTVGVWESARGRSGSPRASITFEDANASPDRLRGPARTAMQGECEDPAVIVEAITVVLSIVRLRLNDTSFGIAASQRDAQLATSFAKDTSLARMVVAALALVSKAAAVARSTMKTVASTRDSASPVASPLARRGTLSGAAIMHRGARGASASIGGDADDEEGSPGLPRPLHRSETAESGVDEATAGHDSASTSTADPGTVAALVAARDLAELLIVLSAEPIRLAVDVLCFCAPQDDLGLARTPLVMSTIVALLSRFCNEWDPRDAELQPEHHVLLIGATSAIQLITRLLQFYPHEVLRQARTTCLPEVLSDLTRAAGSRFRAAPATRDELLICNENLDRVLQAVHPDLSKRVHCAHFTAPIITRMAEEAHVVELLSALSALYDRSAITRGMVTGTLTPDEAFAQSFKRQQQQLIAATTKTHSSSPDTPPSSPAGPVAISAALRDDILTLQRIDRSLLAPYLPTDSSIVLNDAAMHLLLVSRVLLMLPSSKNREERSKLTVLDDLINGGLYAVLLHERRFGFFWSDLRLRYTIIFVLRQMLMHARDTSNELEVGALFATLMGASEGLSDRMPTLCALLIGGIEEHTTVTLAAIIGTSGIPTLVASIDKVRKLQAKFEVQSQQQEYDVPSRSAEADDGIAVENETQVFDEEDRPRTNNMTAVTSSSGLQSQLDSASAAPPLRFAGTPPPSCPGSASNNDAFAVTSRLRGRTKDGHLTLESCEEALLWVTSLVRILVDHPVIQEFILEKFPTIAFYLLRIPLGTVRQVAQQVLTSLLLHDCDDSATYQRRMHPFVVSLWEAVGSVVEGSDEEPLVLILSSLRVALRHTADSANTLAYERRLQNALCHPENGPDCLIWLVTKMQTKWNAYSPFFMCEEVLSTITLLIRGNPQARRFLNETVGAAVLVEGALVGVGFAASREVVDLLLNVVFEDWLDGPVESASNTIQNETLIPPLLAAFAHDGSGQLRYTPDVLTYTLDRIARAFAASRQSLWVGCSSDAFDALIELLRAAPAPCVPSALSCLELLAAHHINVRQLKKLLLSVAQCTKERRTQLLPTVISLLTGAARSYTKRFNEPKQYLAFKARSGLSGLRLKLQQEVPESAGYTFAMWLRPDDIALRRPAKRRACIFSIRGAGGRTVLELSLVAGALVVRSREDKSDSGLMHEVELDGNIAPQSWIHIAVVHRPPSLLNKAEFRLFLNGDETSHTTKPSYPRLSRCEIFIGTNAEDVETGTNANAFYGQINAVYLIRTAVSSLQVRMMFQLGSHNAMCLILRDANNVPASARPLIESALADDVVVCIDPRLSDGERLYNMAGVLASSATAVPGGAESRVEPLEGTAVCETSSILDTICCVGALQTVVLPLFALLVDNSLPFDPNLMSSTAALPAPARRRDATAIDHNMQLMLRLYQSFASLPVVRSEARETGAFTLMAAAISKLANSVSANVPPRVAAICLTLGDFEEECTEALQTLLLNPPLWVHFSADVQCEVYASIRELALNRTKPNIKKYLRRCNAASFACNQIIRFFNRDDSIDHFRIRQKIFELLDALIVEPFHVDDASSIVALAMYAGVCADSVALELLQSIRNLCNTRVSATVSSPASHSPSGVSFSGAASPLSSPVVQSVPADPALAAAMNASSSSVGGHGGVSPSASPSHSPAAGSGTRRWVELLGRAEYIAVVVPLLGHRQERIRIEAAKHLCLLLTHSKHTQELLNPRMSAAYLQRQGAPPVRELFQAADIDVDVIAEKMKAFPFTMESYYGLREGLIGTANIGTVLVGLEDRAMLSTSTAMMSSVSGSVVGLTSALAATIGPEGIRRGSVSPPNSSPSTPTEAQTPPICTPALGPRAFPSAPPAKRQGRGAKALPPPPPGPLRSGDANLAIVNLVRPILMLAREAELEVRRVVLADLNALLATAPNAWKDLAEVSCWQVYVCDVMLAAADPISTAGSPNQSTQPPSTLMNADASGTDGAVAQESGAAAGESDSVSSLLPPPLSMPPATVTLAASAAAVVQEGVALLATVLGNAIGRRRDAIAELHLVIAYLDTVRTDNRTRSLVHSLLQALVDAMVKRFTARNFGDGRTPSPLEVEHIRGLLAVVEDELFYLHTVRTSLERNTHASSSGDALTDSFINVEHVRYNESEELLVASPDADGVSAAAATAEGAGAAPQPRWVHFDLALACLSLVSNCVAFVNDSGDISESSPSGSAASSPSTTTSTPGSSASAPTPSAVQSGSSRSSAAVASGSGGMSAAIFSLISGGSSGSSGGSGAGALVGGSSTITSGVHDPATVVRHGGIQRIFIRLTRVLLQHCPNSSATEQVLRAVRVFQELLNRQPPPSFFQRRRAAGFSHGLRSSMQLFAVLHNSLMHRQLDSTGNHGVTSASPLQGHARFVDTLILGRLRFAVTSHFAEIDDRKVFGSTHPAPQSHDPHSSRRAPASDPWRSTSAFAWMKDTVHAPELSDYVDHIVKKDDFVRFLGQCVKNLDRQVDVERALADEVVICRTQMRKRIHAAVTQQCVQRQGLVETLDDVVHEFHQTHQELYLLDSLAADTTLASTLLSRYWQRFLLRCRGTIWYADETKRTSDRYPFSRLARAEQRRLVQLKLVPDPNGTRHVGRTAGSGGSSPAPAAKAIKHIKAGEYQVGAEEPEDDAQSAAAGSVARMSPSAARSNDNDDAQPLSRHHERTDSAPATPAAGMSERDMRGSDPLSMNEDAEDGGGASRGDAGSAPSANTAERESHSTVAATSAAAEGAALPNASPASPNSAEDDTAAVMHRISGGVRADVPCELVHQMLCWSGKLQVVGSFLAIYIDEECVAYNQRVAKGAEAYVAKPKSQTWPIREIIEVAPGRRYRMLRTAIEFRFRDGSSVLVNFADRDSMGKVLVALKMTPPPTRRFVVLNDQPRKELAKQNLTTRWRRRELSNFDYLLGLNFLAGRTLNDLTQFPVFPWVIADYTSESIDLSDPDTYRDLSNPIGLVGSVSRREEVEARYEEMKSFGDEPFHYFTHYSSAAVPLYFLVRVEPYTTGQLLLQGGRFDHADRMFHSIPSAWKGVTTNIQDVKELIPHIYFFPEMFTNSNRVEFGLKQDKMPMDDVLLPPWAKGSPHLFVQTMREALESDHVSSNLHHWIDLVFGSKQRGTAAVAACNLFHPHTYEPLTGGAVNLDFESRKEVIDSLDNIGQTPIQLFTRRHPERKRDELLHPIPCGAIGAKRENVRWAFPAIAAMKLTATDRLVVVGTDGAGVVFRATPTPVLQLSEGTPSSTRHRLDDMITRFRTHAFSFEVASDFESRVPPLPSGLIPYVDGMQGASPAAVGGGTGSAAAGGVGGTSAAQASSGGAPAATAGLGPGSHSTVAILALPSGDIFSVHAGVFDGSCIVRNLLTRRDEKRLTAHSGRVVLLATTSDSTYMVSGSRDTSFLVWKFDTNNKVFHARVVFGVYGHEDEPTAAAICNQLDVVVTAAKKTLFMHGLRSGTFERALEHPAGHSIDFILILSNAYVPSVLILSRTDNIVHQFSLNGELLASVELKARLSHWSTTAEPTFFMLATTPTAVTSEEDARCPLQFRRCIDLSVAARVDLRALVVGGAETSGDSANAAADNENSLAIPTLTSVVSSSTNVQMMAAGDVDGALWLVGARSL